MITLIKVPGNPTPEELEDWRTKFEEGNPTSEELEQAGIVIEKIDVEASDEMITLIKIGEPGVWAPSVADLEAWRDIFTQAESDEDFRIYTHCAINVEKVPVTNTTIITGDAVLLLQKIK